MDDLKSFSSQMDSWIDGILDSLNWTREGLFKTETNRECPINAEHIMDSTALECHLQYCPLVTAGYTKEELDKEQSSKFFYERASDVCTIDLDDQTIKNILISTGGPIPESLPRTLERSITTFTVPQRLKIYEYCVEASQASNVQNKISDEELFLLDFAQSKEDKPQSKLEMLAKMRDLKRRRQSYKGKNTHTGKKSHTEIIRDVISNQMEILSRMREEEKREKDAKEKLEKEKAERQSSRSGREGAKTTHKESSDEKHKSRHQRKSRERKSEEKAASDVKQPSDRHHHKSKSSKKRRRSKERESRSESESRHKHKKHRSKEKHGERSKDRTKEQEQDLKNNAVAEMNSNKERIDDANCGDTVEGTDGLQARTNDV